ncbi:hypothetical protein LPJ77_006616 [Coemansia sp. RSA 2523]|nr:hypothetical protein LPJ54_006656 [Coemansia sp. RSA 1824]KAJ1761482.1 hypothetical protein LPJ58_001156 [Coemansia sp. RSA 1591]KAJ1766480.1 hypothetical protein LPJ69_000862 [Coemansia sp. RSA 1752]KAJ1787716.1 hypothetical protein LPJ62_003227 [Coemansia sp. RSA 2167]KAJ1795056.1 hypothetical protein LPJ67_000297 [Coemansia sp. RSA 1938]KAJ1797588.1 hypothetical protein LPJ77_006616 [Coemansia sp. RSA 2523]KAJ2133660.1 hypothetical protein GGH17_003159 [Coemansia sp. RSA 788]KAJ2155204
MPVELLTEDLDFTPECERALLEIFTRYDKDKDGALNDTELQAFATFTNGHNFSSTELEDIRTYLKCTKEGWLLKEGFLQMYSLQSASGDLDETWKDLEKHGYTKDLVLKKE